MKQVLDDTLLDDLMSCLTTISEESLGRSVLQARAITSIFAGVRLELNHDPNEHQLSCMCANKHVHVGRGWILFVGYRIIRMPLLTSADTLHSHKH